MKNIEINPSVQKIMDVIKFDTEIDRLMKELRQAKRDLGVNPRYYLNSPQQVETALNKLFPNSKEDKQKAYQQCLELNVDLSMLFLVNNSRKNNYCRDLQLRKTAFKCVMNYPDLIFNTFIKNQVYPFEIFNIDEIRDIYDNYGKQYYNKVNSGIKSFNNYCTLFNMVLPEEQIDLFIKRIIGRSKFNIVENILKTKSININAQQKEQLESLMLAKTLIPDKKPRRIK